MSQKLDNVILERYTLIKKVGQGAYGDVWKARDLLKGKIVALKKINDAFRNLQDTERTFRQVKYSKILKHPNLVNVYTYHYPHPSKHLYLSMQYIQTDLCALLKRNVLNQTHKSYIFYEVVNAIHYMHSINTIHRDLKPSNILINHLNQVKICDFGLTKSLQQSQSMLSSNVGTKYYRPPQILLGSTTYGKFTDIWSLGCILIEILTNHVIFKAETTIDQLQAIIQYTGKPQLSNNSSYLTPTSLSILKALIPEQIGPSKKFTNTNNPQLQNLLEGMLKFNPEQRLTIQQIANHPYFYKFKKNKKNTQTLFLNQLQIPMENNLTIDQYKCILYNDSEKIKLNIKKQFIENNLQLKNSSKIKIIPGFKIKQIQKLPLNLHLDRSLQFKVHKGNHQQFKKYTSPDLKNLSLIQKQLYQLFEPDTPSSSPPSPSSPTSISSRPYFNFCNLKQKKMSKFKSFQQKQTIRLVPTFNRSFQKKIFSFKTQSKNQYKIENIGEKYTF